MNKFYQFFGSAGENLISAFSSRHYSNLSLYYGDTLNSLDNRKNFLGALGLSYLDLVCAKQVHSSRISCVKEEDRGRGSLSYDTSVPETDAFITDKKNLPLAIFTADCLSVLIYDYKTPAIGLVHAGWRSTKENITLKAIRLMQEKFNSHPDALYVGLGPSIRSCCYEVGEDLKQLFTCGVTRKDGRYYLDLTDINKKQVLDSGVKEDNIVDSGICTSCRNEEFFSYRKEGKSCGRLMSVAMLK